MLSPKLDLLGAGALPSMPLCPLNTYEAGEHIVDIQYTDGPQLLMVLFTVFYFILFYGGVEVTHVQ